MSFKRHHPYRKDDKARAQYAEVILHAEDFIYPLFIRSGVNKKLPVENFSGVYHHSKDSLLLEIENALNIGINKFLLFGVPNDNEKSIEANYAYDENNIVNISIEAIKKRFPSAIIITDVCICSYTLSGHCGIIDDRGAIDNDRTIDILGKIAVAHARAGADFVAPSAMMDGQVWAIRKALDKAGFKDTSILSYAAKYASSFYGPFREAAHSAPAFGDRKSYQLDYRTIEQSLSEIKTDIEEGADWIMVKPAHTYLDIIFRAHMNFPHIPIVGYHVSGEYMMLKCLSNMGLTDFTSAILETHFAIKRAGAHYIITYAAPLIAKYLKK